MKSPVPRTLGALLALSIVTWPWVASGQATSKADVTPRQITVRAEGARAPINIGEVIADLGREGLLNLRVHVNDESTDVTTVLARKALIIGSTIPFALERYLCGLNAHVCAIEWRGKTPALGWRLEKAPPEATVEGIACDPRLSAFVRPLALPPFALCLPDVVVREYETSRFIAYDARRDNLAEIVTRRTGGCQTFDAACRREIGNLNTAQRAQSTPSSPFSPTFRGELRLPVRGQSATLPVFDPGHFSRVTERLDMLAKLPWRIGEKSYEQARLYYTVPAPARLQAHAGPWTWPDPVGEYMVALNAMSYPYKSHAHFSEIKPVAIGVWDTRVDDEHCELVDAGGKAVIMAEPTTPLVSSEGNAPGPGSTCGAKRALGRKVFDHGTHVAGILAARINGHGTAGVNPRAELWSYELQFGARLGTDPDPITRVKKKKNMVLPVVNISLDFLATNPSNTQLADIISNFRRDALFVAAAGNDGKRTDGVHTCTVIPACWSTLAGDSGAISGENIISVAALNASGSALLPHPDDPSKAGTNYGRAFEVAAVGEVVSTLHGHYVGVMSGSSVAAPYVTGLASLIYGTAPPASELSPRGVKERILSTVDLSSTFDEFVRFGRINFTRALDFGKDLVHMKKTACGPGVGPCTPAVRVRKSDLPVVVLEGTLENNDLTAPLQIPARDLRRISAESDTPDSRYWIIFVRDGRLQILRNARVDASSALVCDQPKDVRLDVTKLLDYTACSFARGCVK